MVEFYVKKQFLKDFKKINKKDQKNIINLINAISESDNPIVEYKAAKIVGYENYYRYR